MPNKTEEYLALTRKNGGQFFALVGALDRISDHSGRAVQIQLSGSAGGIFTIWRLVMCCLLPAAIRWTAKIQLNGLLLVKYNV